MYACCFCSVLVLKELPTVYSDVYCRRLFVLHEMVQFVRQLFMLVVRPETLPNRFHLSAWLKVKLNDLSLDPSKRRELEMIFSETGEQYACRGDFNDGLGRVEEVLLSLALNCLDLGGVRDALCVAVSPFCPAQLLYALCADVEYFLDIMLAHGHVRLLDQSAFVVRYRCLLADFREAYPDFDTSETSGVVSTLFRLAGGDELTCRLLNLVFCLCGSGSLHGSNWNVSYPLVGTARAESIFRTIKSWCVCRNVRSAASLSEALVTEVREVILEVPEAGGDVSDVIWNRVGRVAGQDYRNSLLSRLEVSMEENVTAGER